MQIIHENEYEETMKNIVTPYLLACRRELYVPGADYPFRNESKRITGKIHMLQYLSDIDMPKGVVVISHGFTESAVKYDEVAYYFLRKAIMYIFRSIAAMAAAIVLPQTRLWSTSIHGEDISAIF